MTTPTYDGSHPLFPKPNELPVTTFDAIQPQPAWTARQKETEERIGTKLLWAKEQAKLIWKQPAVYTPLAEKIDGKLASDIRRGTSYFGNYFTGYMAADASSKANTFSQCGLDMESLDRLLNHLGLPLSFAERWVQARIYSSGAVIHDEAKSGHTTRVGSQSHKYSTTINLNWLPKTKEALLAINFKTLGPLLDRSGFAMGAWAGDGYVNAAHNALELCHSQEDTQALVAKFGAPSLYRKKGANVLSSEWRGKVLGVHVAALVLGKPRDTSFISARKLAAIRAILDKR